MMSLDKLKKLELHIIVPIAGVILSLFLMFILTPFGVPDSFDHYKSAYALTDYILGGQVYDEYLEMRSCDIPDESSDYIIDDIRREAFIGGLKTKPDADMKALAFCYIDNTGYVMAYIPEAIGIFIARVLGLSRSWMLLLGCAANILVFWTAAGYAIYRMPMAKQLMTVLLLLPITIQQAGSLSYDSMLLASAMLVIAISLSWIYEKKTDKVSVVLFIISALVLLTTKGAVYSPLILLALAALDKGFYRTKRGRKTIIGILMAVIVLLIIATYFGVTTSLIAAFNRWNYIEYMDAIGASAADYLKNPLGLLLVYSNTLWMNKSEYLYQLMGGKLGWLDQEIWPIVTKLAFVILIISALHTTEKPVIGRKLRAFMILDSLLIGFLVMFAMLLYWTPFMSPTILGVQGRYFLPALIPFMLGIIYHKKEHRRLNVKMYCFSGMIVVDILTIVCLMV